jgi:hypothetical protein
LRANHVRLRFVFRQPLIRSTMLMDFFATWIAASTPALRAYRRDVPVSVPMEDDRTEGRAGEPA